jgi:hypothetical protein
LNGLLASELTGVVELGLELDKNIAPELTALHQVDAVNSFVAINDLFLRALFIVSVITSLFFAIT